MGLANEKHQQPVPSRVNYSLTALVGEEFFVFLTTPARNKISGEGEQEKEQVMAQITAVHTKM